MAKKPNTTELQLSRLRTIRGDFVAPELPLLRRLKVELCRTDVRPEKLQGRLLFARQNDAHAAARMAFLVVSAVFDFLRQYGAGDSRPQLNQIEAHLQLTGQPLSRRLSAVFEGKSEGCDTAQARAALEFLLRGLPLSEQDQQAINADLQKRQEEQERHAVVDCLIDYFLRADDPAEGPRFMLAERRLHSTPCSPTELSDELNRVTRKKRCGFTTTAEIVWILGPGFFPRPDLQRALPSALAEAIRERVTVEFVSTDIRPANWDILDSDPRPSASLDAFERAHLGDTQLRPNRIDIGGDAKGDTGLWGFIGPSHQLIYGHVVANPSTPWAAEEFLYLLRGYDVAGKPPIPLVSRANGVEMKAFKKWLKGVRDAFSKPTS